MKSYEHYFRIREFRDFFILNQINGEIIRMFTCWKLLIEL